MYDLLIQNGVVIDGTGSPGYHADVAVRDGKIAKIGRGLEGAAKTIDASGCVVTPGFIDSHSHADGQVLRHPDLREKIEQGITVNIAGQCGGSNVPLSRDETREDFKEIEGLGNEYDLRSDPERYFAALRERRLGSGTAFLIGHGTLRKAVMGMENRAPSADELEAMKNLLRKCMENGARGLSLGLFYAPGSYASTEEAIEIARVVSEYDGVVASHVRDEGKLLFRAVREYLDILKQAGVRGVVSHHKACSSEENWGKVTHTLRMIDEANAAGMDVYCDVYPDVATSTSLSATFLPGAELSRGKEAVAKLLGDPAYRAEMREYLLKRHGDTDYGWVQINQCKPFPQYAGRRLNDIARAHGKDPVDTVFDLMRESKLVGSACYFTICEEDLETVLRHPRAMICTDSGVTTKEGQVHHPRMNGSFPRALGRYVRERQVVPLPEMIRKMTAMPARVYRLAGKGLVWEGMDADLCVFDPEKIADGSDFIDCWKRNEGLSCVLVGGEVVVEDNVYNGKRMARAML